MKINKKKERVVVAMSGGVDSSVVACMLKEQGYDVVGITLKLYSSKTNQVTKKSCCAGQDIYDAKEVARKINIPHYVLNYEKNFKDKVIDNFVDSYRNGNTPIPCIQCNEHIKFSELLSTAKGLGANYLATGHYIKTKNIRSETALFIAKDREKDQSYFLFQLRKEDLNFLKFPLGELEKKDTRKLARRFGIKIAEKPESQDICFIPNGNYREFLSKFKGFGKKGKIINTKNETLGVHSGIENYTVGQRKHLNISLGKPMYVLKINKENNEVVVGEKKYLNENIINIKQLNWIGANNVKNSKVIKDIFVKVRARQCPARGNLTLLSDGRAKVNLEDHTFGIASGQGCVFYSEKGQLLGGGWII